MIDRIDFGVVGPMREQFEGDSALWHSSCPT